MLTAEQIKAARALVDWSQPKLAEASGLSMPTIRRMEGPLGPGRSTAVNVDAVQRALEGAGVVFLEAGEVRQGGPGVRLKS
ncbi:MAG: helix-turn-helix domain-containing protein [bacterium]|jgi:transcriptional regulator with XRE-family HTH domain|nr:helix-turn-helix domain-containing protein [bacterium]